MFSIYRSGAGSGKTFTLVKNYLKHLLKPHNHETFSPDYYKYILAITFTNDATKEMKQRILEEIQTLAYSPKQTNPMLNVLWQEFQADYPEASIDKQTLIQQARRIHRSLLHNYSNFNIQTIDAFNSHIIRTFHKDLGLPYNYELIIHQEELVEETVKTLLEEGKAAGSELLRQYLIAFSHLKLEEGKNWHLGQDLERFTQNLFSETRANFIQVLKNQPLYEFRNTQKQLQNFLKNFKNKIAALAREALNLIAQTNLDPQDFYYGKKGIYGYFEKHIGFDKFSKLEPNSYVLKTVHEDKWQSGTKSPNVYLIRGKLTELYQAIENYKQAGEEQFFIAECLKKNIYQMGLTSRIAYHLEQIKAKHNWLAISDFNPILEEIISTSPAAYIYERIGEKYNHLMIDEFQDTSLIQWHNILPLLLHAVSQDYDCMVVGDCKQAIYRWRGGEADSLAKLPKIETLAEDSPLYEDALALTENTHTEQLDSNYRSAKIVVDFNNTFFEYLCQAESQNYPSLKNYYSEVRQAGRKGNLSGAVDLVFLESGKRKADYQDCTLKALIDVIKAAEERGFRKRDIAILTRNGSELKHIAEALTEAKIPVISDESLVVTVALSIKLIIQTLELFYYQSAKYQYNFLVGFSTYCKNYSALNITDLSGEDWEGLKAILGQNKLNNFLNWFNEYYNLTLREQDLKGFSLYEVVAYIIRLFKIDTIEAEAVYLDKFLDFVADFSGQQSNLTGEFLNHWNKNKDRLAISALEEVDALRLMTVHKSKGLEFEVVILAFASWSLEPHRSAELWQVISENPFNNLQEQVVILPFKKDLEKTRFKTAYLQEKEKIFVDSINILYVALTRAKRQLYILTKGKEDLIPVETPKNVEDLFCNWISDLGSAKLPCTETAELGLKAYHFEFAELTQKYKPEGDKVQSEFLKTERLVEKPLRKGMIIAHQDLVEGDMYTLTDFIHSPQKRGVLMHQALQKIRYYEDIDLALRNLQTRGLLTPETWQDLAKRLNKLLSSELLKPYYERTGGFKILNEKAIYNRDRKQVFRPDRILLKGREAIIIDYKTGQKNSKYNHQVKTYVGLLENMGYETKSFLAYIDLEEVAACI